MTRYWSGPQRANVEAARAAGIHLLFLSGNEMFWKTRWEPSMDGSGTPYRTLVSYKETHANQKIDPDPAWTGTWRDPRFSPPADGGRPENGLTGTLFSVETGTSAITVGESFSRMRLWRNTSVASLAPGAVATLGPQTLGYEWNEDIDNGHRPSGLMQVVVDNGQRRAPPAGSRQHVWPGDRDPQPDYVPARERRAGVLGRLHSMVVGSRPRSRYADRCELRRCAHGAGHRESARGHGRAGRHVETWPGAGIGFDRRRAADNDHHLAGKRIRRGVGRCHPDHRHGGRRRRHGRRGRSVGRRRRHMASRVRPRGLELRVVADQHRCRDDQGSRGR